MEERQGPGEAGEDRGAGPGHALEPPDEKEMLGGDQGGKVEE